MIHSPYILLSLISSIALFSYGIHLLAGYVPRQEEARPYLASRRVLAGAYFALALPQLYEVLMEDRLGHLNLVGCFTLTVAAWQAFLFTSTLLVLVNPGFITWRKLAAHLGCITAGSALLLTAFFRMPPVAYRVVYALSLAAYIGQLVYYIFLFRTQYRTCLRRLSDYYDEDEDKRLGWIRQYFYLALAIGVMAVFAGMLPKVYFCLFIVAYTLYYVYFAIKYCDYMALFSYVLRAVAAPAAAAVPTEEATPETCGTEPGKPKEFVADSRLEERIQQWIADKKFTQTDVTIGDVAEELGMNRSYFSRYLNTQKNTDFRNWRTRLRIEEASRLLLIYPDKSLANIAEEVGISDTSNFRKHFIDIKGITPQEWRDKEKGS